MNMLHSVGSTKFFKGINWTLLLVFNSFQIWLSVCVRDLKLKCLQGPCGPTKVSNNCLRATFLHKSDKMGRSHFNKCFLIFKSSTGRTDHVNGSHEACEMPVWDHWSMSVLKCTEIHYFIYLIWSTLRTHHFCFS